MTHTRHRGSFRFDRPLLSGNPVPMFNPYYRPGNNLYTNSLVSWDPDTGKMNWHFQYTPGDMWDYDEAGTHILIDGQVAGQARKLIAHSGRNGFFYALERSNGQAVLAKPYVDTISWTKGIDQKTGLPLDYDRWSVDSDADIDLPKLLKADVVIGSERSIDETREEKATGRREGCAAIGHPIGTARMGNDADAVVDSKLRVHGVSGLRVADARTTEAIKPSGSIADCSLSYWHPPYCSPGFSSGLFHFLGRQVLLENRSPWRATMTSALGQAEVAVIRSLELIIEVSITDWLVTRSWVFRTAGPEIVNGPIWLCTNTGFSIVKFAGRRGRGKTTAVTAFGEIYVFDFAVGSLAGGVSCGGQKNEQGTG
jgi:GMC oxidoreductase